VGALTVMLRDLPVGLPTAASSHQPSPMDDRVLRRLIDSDRLTR
jgi:hypothetical protein